MSNAWDTFATLPASNRVQTLRDAIANGTVPARSIVFASDLIEKYDNGGQVIDSLSPKQWAWLGHLAGHYERDSVYAWLNASGAGKGTKGGKSSSGYRRTYRRKATGQKKAKTGTGSKTKSEGKSKTAQDTGPTCTAQERALLDTLKVWATDKKRQRKVWAVIHPDAHQGQPWAEELFKAWHVES